MRSIPPAVFTPASDLSAPLHGALHDAAPQSRLSLQLPPPLPYTPSFKKPSGRGRERCTAPILSPAACIYVLLYRAVHSKTAETGPISLDEQTSFVKRRPVCGYQAARSAPSLRQAACTSSSGASLQIRPSPPNTCAPSPWARSTQSRIHWPSPQP